MNPVKRENAGREELMQMLTKCLISASLREAVGFCSPETGCKVLAHTGFSSGLSVLSDYW